MNEPAQPTGVVSPPQASAPPAVSGSVRSKEAEVMPSPAGESVPLREAGYDIELPKEVAAAGVRTQPTHVPVPPQVTAMGVRATGTNASTAGAAAIPLTDDQIAFGLKQGINESVRWLAQWCLRRLSQLHISFTVKGGKVQRKS